LTEDETVGWLPPISVAVTVQVPVVDGAEKIPDVLEIDPQDADQVTSTVAENCSVLFTTTVGFVGSISNAPALVEPPETVTT
jgi:hypothetical protein